MLKSLLMGVLAIALASCSTARSAGPAYKGAAPDQKLARFTVIYVERPGVPAGQLSVLHQRGTNPAMSQAHLADAPQEIADLLVKVNGFAHDRLTAASGADKHVSGMRFIKGGYGIPPLPQMMPAYIAANYPDVPTVDGAVLLIEPFRGDYYCEKMTLAPDWCRPRLMVRASLMQKNQLLWSFDVQVQRDSLLIPLSSETIDTMWGTISRELGKSSIIAD